MTWIKCSERLPEEGVCVLALTKTPPRYLERYSIDILLFSDGHFSPETLLGTCAAFAVINGVTHWQELPSPPEEE